MQTREKELMTASQRMADAEALKVSVEYDPFGKPGGGNKNSPRPRDIQRDEAERERQALYAQVGTAQNGYHTWQDILMLTLDFGEAESGDSTTKRRREKFSK